MGSPKQLTLSSVGADAQSVLPNQTSDADPRWRHVLVATAARALLALVASLVFWSVAPLVLGWHPSVVMTGSMAPAVQPGDVLVSKPAGADDLHLGAVLVVKDPDHPGRLRSHRLEHIRQDGTLVLHGDANPTADSSSVSPADVVGVAVLRVPYVGSPAVWVAGRRVVPFGLTAAVLGLAVLASQGARGPGCGPGSPGSPRARARGRWRRRRAVAVAVTTAAMVVELSGGTTSAAFAAKAVNAGNQLAAATSFYPYRDAVLADAPLLYWRLAETSGSAVTDTSGNARTATYYNNPTLGESGPLQSESRDRAISTGGSDFLTADAVDTGPGTFTVEAWFKTTSTAGGRILGYGNKATNRDSVTTDRQLYTSPAGKAVFGMGTTKTVIASPASLNNGVWHHVVGTYSLTTGMRLFVDGALVSSATGATPITLNGYWRAGYDKLTGWPNAPTGGFVGSLDELAVYPSALSAARIQAHYTAATTP